MGLFKRKKKETKEMDMQNLPRHIAFIMDGNRRWAKQRGLPSLAGHKEGAEALKRVVRRASELGIENLSFFCFSTENFKRSKEEVDYLFDLFKQLYNHTQDFIKHGYRAHICGDRSLIKKDVLDLLEKMEEETKGGTKGTINLLIAYGGRNDIVNAAKKIVSENVKIEDIDEESFKKYLSTGDMPDVDLLVRTSGENRISGFLLYNMAYAELYFVNKHWPSFTGQDVDDCVIEFQKRNRRFGG